MDQRLNVLAVLLLLPCLSVSISSRVGTRDAVPAPIVVPSSQSWEGNDGPWSTFAIQIGTPPQTLKVLVSTSSTETWAVTPEGCIAGDAINCQKLRGEIWNYNDSTTYVPNTANISSSIYGLDLGKSWGLTGRGRYGFDNVALGWQGSGGPTLKNQTVAGIATKDYFMGLFGISPRPSNFTNFNHPIPSYVQNLRNQSLIPSTSWAYTAGNPYRLNAVFGSLTLGGYDRARFIPNQVYFPLSSTADFPVQIQGIFTNNTASLLSTPVPASLDSTVPYLYLPNATCLLFEKAFGLVWNDTANLYLLNDTQYATLKAKNPTITLKLSPQGSTATVNITLPYSAFDLTASAPLVTSKTRYFPLKPSNNTVPTTIGRIFFQEAYLIADFERKNFTISQCNWEGSLAQNIIAISPPTNGTSSDNSTSGSPLHLGAIIGIAVGGTMLLLLCCTFVYVYFIKPRRKHIAELATTAERTRLDPNNDMIKPEMDGTGVVPVTSPYKDQAFEADGTKIAPAVEAPGADIQPIFELPAREEVAVEMTGIGNRNAETTLQPPRRNSKRKQMFRGRSRTSGNSSDAVSPDSPANHGLISPVSPQSTDPGSATMTSTAGSDALRQMRFPPVVTSTSPPPGEGTFSSTASSDILQQMGYHNVRSTGSPVLGTGEGTYSSGATSDILGVMGFPPRSPPPNLGEGTGQFSFVAGSDHLGGRSNMSTPGPPEDERTFSSAQSMQRHRQIRHKSSSEQLRGSSITPVSSEQESVYKAYSPEQSQQQTPRSPTRRPVPNSSNNTNVYHQNSNPENRRASPGHQQSPNLQQIQHLQGPLSPNPRLSPSPSRPSPNIHSHNPSSQDRNPSPVSSDSSTNLNPHQLPPQFPQPTSRQPSPATNLRPQIHSNLNLADIRRSLAPSLSPAPSFTASTHQSVYYPSHSNLNTNINPNPNPDTEPPSPLDEQEQEPGTGTWDSTLSSGSDILDVLGYGNVDIDIPPQPPLPTHIPEPEHDQDFHVAPLRLSRGPSLSPNPRPSRGGGSGVSSRVSSVSPIRGEEHEETDLGIRPDPRIENGNRGAGGGGGYRPYRGEPS